MPSPEPFLMCQIRISNSLFVSHSFRKCLNGDHFPFFLEFRELRSWPPGATCGGSGPIKPGATRCKQSKGVTLWLGWARYPANSRSPLEHQAHTASVPSCPTGFPCTLGSCAQTSQKALQKQQVFFLLLRPLKLSMDLGEHWGLQKRLSLTGVFYGLE